jgi:acetolactate synthase-1/2/3 large subunit
VSAESDALLEDLARADRPGILVGGGAYKARDAVMAFASDHHIPVFRTWNALDVATDDEYCYAGTVGTYGGPGRNFGVQNADLLLVLGCRISGRITGGSPQTFARHARKWWVDLDADLLAEHEVRPDVAVQMDVGQFIDMLPTSQRIYQPWLERCKSWVAAFDSVDAGHFEKWHHYGFMRALSQEIPDNAIVTYDTGGNAIMMGHCFRSKRGQRIFSSNGNTPMGFSLCGAIGAWFAEPERPVVCIIGDGGMQLNIQELQTVKHYGIPLKVFIVNNETLGNTKAYQRVNGKPEICCGPDGYSAPNFTAIAKAYGLKTLTLGEWDRFEFVVQNALASEDAVVVDVIDKDRCDYKPRISRWDLPIEDAEPFLPRKEFRSQMIVEPVEGWEKNGAP